MEEDILNYLPTFMFGGAPCSLGTHDRANPMITLTNIMQRLLLDINIYIIHSYKNKDLEKGSRNI